MNTYISADIDQKTGEFISESLSPYKSLAEKSRLIKGE